MSSKVFKYSNDSIEVSWDSKRCIHAEECIHGLPEVFDITKKPWINPDGANGIDKLKEVIHKCPTGALQYNVLKSDETEPIPATNKITLAEDGPVYLSGNLVLLNNDGEEIMRDTRMALCRCGASSNKPFCDNSHIKAEFKANTKYNPERLELEPSADLGGELQIRLLANAPFVVDGNYEVLGDQEPTKTAKRMSFCRCGASENKPFCDGSHRKIEFKA
ncbi:MAG: CDGSH iron-sulfur domain-containing protein [Balneolaceae bacterium]